MIAAMFAVPVSRLLSDRQPFSLIAILLYLGPLHQIPFLLVLALQQNLHWKNMQVLLAAVAMLFSAPHQTEKDLVAEEC
jgi:hypothetical protein